MQPRSLPIFRFFPKFLDGFNATYEVPFCGVGGKKHLSLGGELVCAPIFEVNAGTLGRP